MSDRVVPWRSKPTQDIVALFESLSDVRLYVVNRAGPTAFYIQEDGVEATRRVILGVQHKCSCPGSKSAALCIHMAFVLLRVLKVSKDNPLAWQSGLVGEWPDRELESVLACSIWGDRTKARKKPANKDSEKIPRKPLDEEDPCPICYEDMQQCSLRELVFCRSGCGRNIHGRCLRIWSEHQRSKGTELSCPLCRVTWGSFNWTPPPDCNRKPRSKTPPQKCADCSICKADGAGCFKCLTCIAFHLCGNCFRSGAHMEHRFARQGDAMQREITRSEMMPNCTSILNSTASNSVNAPKWGRRTQGSTFHTRRLCHSAPTSNPALSDVSLGIVGHEVGRRPHKGTQCALLNSQTGEHQSFRGDAIDKHLVSVFGSKCFLRTAGVAGNKTSTIHRGLGGLGVSRKRTSLPSISDNNVKLSHQ